MQTSPLPNSRTFSPPFKEALYPLPVTSLTPVPQTMETLAYDLLWWIFLFCILHINKVVKHMTFCNWPFTWQNVCNIKHPRCSVYQYLISFYGWITFYCMRMPHFVYSSIDGHLGCFHILVIIRRFYLYMLIAYMRWPINIYKLFSLISCPRTRN